MGQFLGFSYEHFTLLSNVRNLITRFISPQFYLVFNDLFETVISTIDDESVLTPFEMIFLN